VARQKLSRPEQNCDWGGRLEISMGINQTEFGEVGAKAIHRRLNPLFLKCFGENVRQMLLQTFPQHCEANPLRLFSKNNISQML
jgi:hypothetical protein